MKKAKLISGSLQISDFGRIGTMYCSSCGKQVQEDVAFCPYCGNALPKKESQTQSSPAPQAPMRPQTPSYQTKPHQSHAARNAILGFLLIVIIAGVVLVAFVPGIIPGVSIPGGKPATVTVSGSVTTTGTLTNPEKITFTSETTGNTYVASCSGGMNPASYSISLPNGDTYTVTITWKALGVTGGNANAGTLNLNTFNSNLEENWSG